jgi:hypothetical protein
MRPLVRSAHGVADAHRLAPKAAVRRVHERGIEEHDDVAQRDRAGEPEDPHERPAGVEVARAVTRDDADRQEDRAGEHEGGDQREQREKRELLVVPQDLPR